MIVIQKVPLNPHVTANQAYANAFQKLLDENVTSVNLVFGTSILVLDVKNVIVIQWVLMITIVTILTVNAVVKLALERNPAPLVSQDIGDFLLGMISCKKATNNNLWSQA